MVFKKGLRFGRTVLLVAEYKKRKFFRKKRINTSQDRRVGSSERHLNQIFFRAMFSRGTRKEDKIGGDPESKTEIF